MKIVTLARFEPDKQLAIFGLVVSFALAVYMAVNVPQLLYLMPVILAFTFCLVWLLIREKVSLAPEVCESSIRIARLLASLFFLLLALSILSIYLREHVYERPLVYFILIALMTGIVALGILLVPANNKFAALTLSQIIVLGLNIVWSQQLMFPSVTGIDPVWHRMFTLEMVETGHILQGLNYSNLPLMHLHVGSFSLVTGLAYKPAAMISIGFLQVFSGATFVFLIGKSLFNIRIGLLGSLLLIEANAFIQFSWWITPFGFAAVYALIIFCLLLKGREVNALIISILVFFVMFCLILTHPMTSMWVAILLFVGWASFYYRRRFSSQNFTLQGRRISFLLVIFFSVAMFSWWIYASGHITVLTELLKWGFSLGRSSTTVQITGYWINRPISEQVFDNIGLILYFGMSIMGCMFMLSRNVNTHTTSLAFGGLITMAISFSSVVGEKVLSQRWIYFSEILLSIPVAVTFFLLLRAIRKGFWRPATLFILTSSLSFLMIISTTANVDNSLFFENSSIRYAFSESELAAGEFFAQNSHGNIASDFDYSTNPSSSVFANYFEVHHRRIVPLDNYLLEGYFPHDGVIKIIRYEIVHNPFRLSGGVYRLGYDPNIVLTNSQFGRIYDNSAVTAYV